MKRLLAFTLISSVFWNAATTAAIAQTKTKNSKTNSSAATAPKFDNTDGITAQQMKNYLEFIASEELEGRDTPSRGLYIAADD